MTGEKVPEGMRANRGQVGFYPFPSEALGELAGRVMVVWARESWLAEEMRVIPSSTSSMK